MLLNLVFKQGFIKVTKNSYISIVTSKKVFGIRDQGDFQKYLN